MKPTQPFPPHPSCLPSLLLGCSPPGVCCRCNKLQEHQEASVCPMGLGPGALTAGHVVPAGTGPGECPGGVYKEVSARLGGQSPWGLQGRLCKTGRPVSCLPVVRAPGRDLAAGTNRRCSLRCVIILIIFGDRGKSSTSNPRKLSLSGIRGDGRMMISAQ